MVFLRGASAGDHDVRPTRQATAQVAEGFAQGALDAVAADRMRVDLARHRQANARVVVGTPQGLHAEPGRLLAHGRSEDRGEISRREQSSRAWKSVPGSQQVCLRNNSPLESRGPQ